MFLAQLAERWSRNLHDNAEAGSTDGQLAKRLRWDDWYLPNDNPAVPILDSEDPSHPPIGIIDSAAALPGSDGSLWKARTRSLGQFPFGSLLGGLVRAPVIRLKQRWRALRDAVPGGSFLRVRESAWECFERDLGQRLLEVAGTVLLEEFRAFCSPSRQLFALLDDDEVEDHSKSPHGSSKFYDAFLERNEAHASWIARFREYPVLQRLVEQIVTDWSNAAEELLERWILDRSEIEGEFGILATTLQGVDSSLSDSHRGGRRVSVLDFEQGRTVYKPRSLRLDRLFDDVCNWTSRQQGMLDLRSPHVIDRGTYGWAEFIEHGFVANDDERSRFYRRAGMLAAWLHVLQGVDFHRDNLIASGEHPVLIDLETLLVPHARSFDSTELTSMGALDAKARLRGSAMRSDLLPAWTFPLGRKPIDSTGLGSIDDDDATTLAWSGIGTDAISRRWEPAPRRSSHLPSKGLTAAALHYHAEDVIEGFTQVYRLVLEHRGELLAPQGPLGRLDGATSRFVVRNTSVYSTLLDRARSTEELRDGLLFSLELERLAEPFLVLEGRPAIWTVLREELRSLGRGDIPYFETRTGERSLRVDDREVCDLFDESGAEAVHRTLRSMDEQDLRFQQSLIRAAFNARVGHFAGGVVSEPGGNHTARSSSNPGDAVRAPNHAVDLLDEAVRIGGILADQTIRDGEGYPQWIGLSAIEGSDRFQLKSQGDDLYDGRCGIALGFAGLAAATGDSKWRDLAASTVETVHWLRLSRSDGAGFARELLDIEGVGLTGLGGILYSLGVLSHLLGEPGWIDRAEPLLALLDDHAVDRIHQSDLVSGLSGCILGVLALHDWRPEWTSKVLDRLGNRLLARIHDDDEPATRLSGISHGCAGIVRAILALDAVRPSQALRDSAARLLFQERKLFDPAQANWRDVRALRSVEAPDFLMRWCHGAPGIALARSAFPEFDPATLAECDIAIDSTATAEESEVDHLCCGTFGIADMLCSVGRRISRPELVEQGKSMASFAADRAQRSSGCYRLFADLPPSASNFGFFVGLAGILYAQLRIHGIGLPDVLMMERPGEMKG